MVRHFEDKLLFHTSRLIKKVIYRLPIIFEEDTPKKCSFFIDININEAILKGNNAVLKSKNLYKNIKSLYVYTNSNWYESYDAHNS